jgi:long-chain acyl-CoA synthetase
LYSCRPLTVAGSERLRRLEGPVLFIGNHSSYLDAPSVFRALPRSWRSRVATAMATEPFEPIFSGGGTGIERARQRLRYILATLAFNAFPLPRSSGFRASLEYAGELADRGVSTLIFPEGRMTTTGQMGPFRGGIGILAKELRVPVIPLRIHGLHAVLPPERRWPRPGPVTIVFGEPLRFAPDEDAAAIIARLEAAVRGL